MLANEIQRRGITELLHFTTNRGIVGTLSSGQLLSRYRLPDEDSLQYILHVNATNRPEAGHFFDKSENWLDYVNLSISEINRRYFEVSQRWHVNADIWWGILSFDASAIEDDNVYFATTNNSYDCCVRRQGLEGFNELFAPLIRRKSNGWSARRASREDRLPTCEQAEVLYPRAVPAHYLRRIYVMNETCHDTVKGWLRQFQLPTVDVLIAPQKFEGIPN
ncbi:DarT ssDNA thymidine ADP-ribosyltransferase family protein [Pseudomonas aeruginosa]|uniref:DarT ssDNA thymidine ADP-ribosyltransferase family protein n=1 Tax=Pseudomonas aeruginosa TaxID=287 RepID=UPI000EAD069E|nr:DarT ssDNA thymidine ADP-ribosyltransferase family protein [Pseudomonas aeruginosa]HBO2745111.1 DUF4433 domain-containing protein [Pseudomonas aeruginosa]HDY6331756.1 DUF4433 domain-containing protein [Pseudomonas aeruginosa]